MEETSSISYRKASFREERWPPAFFGSSAVRRGYARMIRGFAPHPRGWFAFVGKRSSRGLLWLVLVLLSQIAVERPAGIRSQSPRGCGQLGRIPKRRSGVGEHGESRPASGSAQHHLGDTSSPA